MMELLNPDICVIGGGSGGLSVAAAAAAFGVHVVLVEKDRMGGDCLNYGCVPSKALIAAARQAQTMRDGAAFGIGAVEPTVDFQAVHRHIHDVIATIAPNDSTERFTALGVHVIKADARFRNRRTLIAGETEIRARRFVIATGSSPLIPSIPGLDTVACLTNETIFELRQLPGHLIVIGGGPAGMELAQAYRRLGAAVTVIEARSALGKEDPELAAVVLSQLRNEGVDIYESASITKVERRGDTGMRVHFTTEADTRTVDGTHLLVAAGRRANIAGLDLERAGIACDQNGLKLNKGLRTTNRRICAIGDVAGSMQFTHVANYHASLVVRAILFRLPARENRRIIPRVTFTDPELAHIGLSEDEARKQRLPVRVLRWPYAENDRALAERRTQGHIKLIASRRGRILGVSIVGANAGELINTWSLALSKSLKISDIARFIVPYPTMGEVGKRAAITYFIPTTRGKTIRRLIRFLRLFG